MNEIVTYSFCESFIERLADHIEQDYLRGGNDLSRLALVFGGRRPALFLNRELARRVRGSFYPPKYFTMDEFIDYILAKGQAFRPILDMDNSYLLYKLAQQVAPQMLEGRERFCEFLPWTKEILSFIDQLDLERIDNERLYNIQANADIGYDVPEDINRLLGRIVSLREAYHGYMNAQQKYSRGFQYLRASELVEQMDFEEFSRILFCNPFYFSRCEERIVKSLYERRKAGLVFQGDQRKWPVLERLARDFSCEIREGEVPRAPQFRLNLYAAFDVHSQVGMAREILKKVNNIDRALVLLPDGGHLVPLLSEIAGVVKEFNVSMGYPLKRSSLYSLCRFVFQAQLSKKEGRFYAKDYLKALRHPFIKNLCLPDGVPAAAMRLIAHKIEEMLTGKEPGAISGSLFIHPDEIAGSDDLSLLILEAARRREIAITQEQVMTTIDRVHRLLFLDWEGAGNFYAFGEVLGKFLDTLMEGNFMERHALNLTIAARMYAIKDEFQGAGFRDEMFEKEEIFKIFESRVEGEMVSFRGSPLAGLQILGPFETRSLSFEDVIIMDVNEGILPHLEVRAPLIPREVMIGLGLGRKELEEEIQRYHFMRLISSAKNVHLIYQEGKDKERSRFVEELIWEEEKQRQRTDVVPVAQASFALKVCPSRRIIQKTGPVLAHLKNMRYSASSVNTYLRDPVEFYDTCVLGLREQDDLLDEPQARQVGTFIHELLEEAFKPFLNKKPKIDNVFRSRFVRIFEEKFENSLARSLRSDAFMLRTVIAERMSRFLDNEQFGEGRDVEEILYLEKRFEDTLRLSCGDIRFSYIVDRVDRLKDGTHLIIDYKTGGLEQMPQAVERISRMELSRESIRERVRSFQMPLYFYCLGRVFNGKPVNAALYTMRTAKLHKFIDDRAVCPAEKINEVFLNALDFILSEILDPCVDFESEVNHAYRRA